MSLNPLTQVTDYPSMLNRIFLFTAISSSVATWMLRNHFPWFNDQLKFLDINVDLPFVKEITVLGYLLPGIAVAFFARAIRLHDRISDFMRIRERFEVNEILRPLAEQCGVPIGNLSLDLVRAARRRLMGRVFYKYTSSTTPKIDRHLINEALDWWSWYWSIIESLAVFVAAGVTLLFAHPMWHGWAVLSGCLVVAVIALPFFRAHCARYAADEVYAILAEETRKGQVLKAFSALSS